jgi:sugar lactone lactonase YvrE
MSGKMKYAGIVVALLSLITLVACSGQAKAMGQIEIVTTFDAAKGELPEGVAIDKPGNIYVSLGPPFFVGGGYGAMLKISPDGSEKTVLAEYPAGPAPAGLAVDAPGNVYYALPDPGGADAGVYHVAEGSDPERLPGTENMIVPNGLALDKQGNLFVSDSAMGAIWRMQPEGSKPAEIWLQHELIAGCTPDDLGANGIAFWKGDLYVANTGRGALVHIPIMTDGSPGDPKIVAGDTDCEPDDLFGMDGIALDVHGNVYALLVLQNKLVRIDPADGTFTTLLTEENGLWNGASIAFGTGKGNKESIFISNYAVLPPEPTNSLGPAILKIDVGVPGLPLP